MAMNWTFSRDIASERVLPLPAVNRISEVNWLKNSNWWIYWSRFFAEEDKYFQISGLWSVKMVNCQPYTTYQKWLRTSKIPKSSRPNVLYRDRAGDCFMMKKLGGWVVSSTSLWRVASTMKHHIRVVEVRRVVDVPAEWHWLALTCFSRMSDALFLQFLFTN